MRGMSDDEFARIKALRRDRKAEASRRANADRERINQRQLRNKRLEFMCVGGYATRA